MNEFARHMLVFSALLAACSSPADEPKPLPDGGVDAATRDLGSNADADGVDATGASDMPDAGDMASPPFDFGFDAEPFDIVLDGLHPATVWWDGTERTAQFFLLNGGAIGTLTFDVGPQTFTYRLQGVFDFSGEVMLGLSERSCNEAGEPCGDDVPQGLRESMVYDAIGRYDGTQIVFAPLTIRPEARSLAPDFDFTPPLDPRMTPNDGFKPAQVPEPAANWVGQVTFIPGGEALTGTRECTIVIEQPAQAYELTSMSCGETTFELGGDPGPDDASLVVDTDAFIVELDFQDGGTRYTFAGQVDLGTFTGVIVEASRYDELGSPTAAGVDDLDGLFYLEDTPP